MQDKIFRVLLILSAVVIPIIGGGIVYSLTADYVLINNRSMALN